MKYPKSMAACADLLYDMRQKRLDADKVAARLKEDENALLEHIIQNLPKDSGGAVGKHHKVETYNATKLVVKDWDALWGYVFKKKRPDLLQKRLSDTAVQELMDDGKVVPGVEPFTIVKVSLTATKGGK
jgi:hypothetical protein